LTLSEQKTPVTTEDLIEAAQSALRVITGIQNCMIDYAGPRYGEPLVDLATAVASMGRYMYGMQLSKHVANIQERQAAGTAEAPGRVQ